MSLVIFADSFACTFFGQDWRLSQELKGDGGTPKQCPPPKD